MSLISFTAGGIINACNTAITGFWQKKDNAKTRAAVVSALQDTVQPALNIHASASGRLTDAHIRQINSTETRKNQLAQAKIGKMYVEAEIANRSNLTHIAQMNSEEQRKTAKNQAQIELMYSRDTYVRALVITGIAATIFGVCWNDDASYCTSAAKPGAVVLLLVAGFMLIRNPQQQTGSDLTTYRGS
jgi:hypothetical protein